MSTPEVAYEKFMPNAPIETDGFLSVIGLLASPTGIEPVLSP